MSQDPLPNEVAQIVIECLELEDYTPETFPKDQLLFGPKTVGGMELDSLAALEIVSALSTKFNLPLDDVARDDMISVYTIAEYVRRHRERPGSEVTSAALPELAGAGDAGKGSCAALPTSDPATSGAGDAR